MFKGLGVIITNREVKQWNDRERVTGEKEEKEKEKNNFGLIL